LVCPSAQQRTPLDVHIACIYGRPLTTSSVTIDASLCSLAEIHADISSAESHADISLAESQAVVSDERDFFSILSHRLLLPFLGVSSTLKK
jgi:hypothetical protein